MVRSRVFVWVLMAGLAGCDRAADVKKAAEPQAPAGQAAPADQAPAGQAAPADQEALARSRVKAAEMKAEVERVVKIRQAIAPRIDELQQAATADPAKAASALQALLDEHMQMDLNVGVLFGPDLARIGDSGIRATFELYKHATALRIDLAMLLGFMHTNTATLSGAAAPSRFAVQTAGDRVLLVERGDELCGDQPCEGDRGRPTHYMVRRAAQDPFTPAPIGTREGEVQALAPDGGMYMMAVGMNPQNNVRMTLALLFMRAKEDLEAMGKAEDKALKALTRYADDPTAKPGPA